MRYSSCRSKNAGHVRTCVFVLFRVFYYRTKTTARVKISWVAFGVHCSGNAEGIVFLMCAHWQVTGCILGSISELKDVHEYVQDEVKRQAVKTIKMRHLLKYIKRIDRAENRKRSISMVRMHHRLLPIFTLCSHLSCLTPTTYLNVHPLLNLRHNRVR